MSNLATAISSAISKSLLAKLPTEAATKFSLDENEFKEFLQGFLTSQLKGASKSGRTSGAKGTNGKGRISGYLLFSNATRDSVKAENPDIKFTDIGRRLGDMWQSLSDKDKASWNDRAAKQNEDNGIPTPAPAVKGAKRAPKAAVETPSGEMKVSRHKGSNAWVVQGTPFVVNSSKNKVVTGKLVNDKVVALSAADRKKCQESGWEVQAPAAAAPKGKGKGKAAKKESNSDSE